LTPVRSYLRARAERVDQALEAVVAAYEDGPPPMCEAIRYSLFSGGKRLRPVLCLGAAEMLGAAEDEAMPAACALEMIHTYSLIHDDLPAMDNDDLRRGKPTLHKVYGEAMAILAGDSLLTMAFDAAAQTGRVDVVRELALASGATGMAGGQCLDLQAVGQRLGLNDLQRIHALKTGALIRGAVRAGAMIANANPAALAALTRYGEQLGLAFQIADDILDVVGQEQVTGKRVGGDAERRKATYASLLGVDNARVLAQEAAEAANDALTAFGPEAGMLRALANFVITREG